MQVIKAAIMALARHAGILQPEVAHMPQYGMYAPPANGREMRSLSNIAGLCPKVVSEK